MPMDGDHSSAGLAKPQAAAARSSESTDPTVVSASQPLRRALQDAASIILGFLPYGIVLGVTIGASPIPDLTGWAMSPLIFAGAAQLALLELLDSDAAAAVVIAAALIINLRHVMYSGAMSPWFRGAPTWLRYGAPFLLADPVYAFSASRFPELDNRHDRWRYYVALGVTLWLAWQTLTALGLLAAAWLPSAAQLQIAVPLVFVGLLVPTLTDRSSLAAAIVGGGAALVAQGLPLHLGLLVGASSGIVAGVLLDPELRP